jgi:hypothetical protein
MPIGGGCGQTVIYDSKGLTNLYSAAGTDSDRRCFYRAVARFFIPSDDEQLLNGFVENNLDTSSFDLPFRVSKIAEFERRNGERLNFKINVIFEEGGEYYPIYVSRQEIRRPSINILLYHEASGGPGQELEAHYVYVADLDKLLRKTYRGRSGKKTYSKRHVCPNCLNGFSSLEIMERHFQRDCHMHRPQTVIMPSEDDCLTFKSYNKRFRVPVCGFFDFEAVQRAPERDICEGICQDPATCFHRTTVEAVQQAGTYSFVLINFNDEIIHSRTYSGADAAADFINHLLDIEPWLQQLLQVKKPMELTPVDEAIFEAATDCHICERPLLRDHSTGKLIKSRDHDHLSGK